MKKSFIVTEQLSNNSLDKVVGGQSASRISVTISMAQNAKAVAEDRKDSDSDADEAIIL